MQKSWYKIFNYGSIALVFVLAGMLIIDLARGTYDLIPKIFYMPLLIVLIVIFIIRILIRGYLIKKSKTQI
jgi:hypothetical protein